MNRGTDSKSGYFGQLICFRLFLAVYIVRLLDLSLQLQLNLAPIHLDGLGYIFLCDQRPVEKGLLVLQLMQSGLSRGQPLIFFLNLLGGFLKLRSYLVFLLNLKAEHQKRMQEKF